MTSRLRLTALGFDGTDAEAFGLYDSRMEADRLGTQARERRTIRSQRKRRDILQKMIELVGTRQLEYDGEAK